MIKYKDYNEIITHVNNMKLPSNIKDYFASRDANKIITFMSKDKKNVSSKINLILLKKISSTVINNEYYDFKIKKFLKKELTN